MSKISNEMTINCSQLNKSFIQVVSATNQLKNN